MDKWVDIDVDDVLKETAMAFLFRIGDEEVWIPKSQMQDECAVSEGDCDTTVSMTAWIAEQKGLL